MSTIIESRIFRAARLIALVVGFFCLFVNPPLGFFLLFVVVESLALEKLEGGFRVFMVIFIIVTWYLLVNFVFVA